MAKKFLTLNIGAANVELAEYEASPKGALTLVNYGVAALAAPLDGGDAEMILSSALQEIMQQTGIRPGPVAISVSGQMAFLRLASIPMAEGTERFEQLVRYEIEQNVPFPIDEMVCDRQPLGETENGDMSVLIAAAKVDQIEVLTGAVAAAGFTPELVDIAPLALVNALRLARPDEGCVVLLDIGSRTTSLAIVEDGRIYNRSIPVAGNVITKEISTALACPADQAEQLKFERGYVSFGGVTEDEDEVTDKISKVCRAVLTRLHAEISRSINFYRSQQGGSAPVKLYLTGGTSLLPQIDQFFAESLGVEVEFLNPFEAVATGPKVDEAALETDGAFLAVANGLAIHLLGQSQFTVNLLPPALVEARAEKAKIPFVAAGGAALFAALALVMWSVKSQVSVVEERRDRLQEEKQALDHEDHQLRAAQAEFAAAEENAAALGQLVSRRTAMLRRLWAASKAIDGRTGTWIDRWSSSGMSIRQWNDPSRTNSGKTAAEAIASSFGGNDVEVIDPASVKIASMSELGAKAQLKQFTVEFKGK